VQSVADNMVKEDRALFAADALLTLMKYGELLSGI